MPEYTALIYIKRNDRFLPVSHFFASRNFHHSFFFVQKIGLDRKKRQLTARKEHRIVPKLPIPPREEVLHRCMEDCPAIIANCHLSIGKRRHAVETVQLGMQPGVGRNQVA